MNVFTAVRTVGLPVTFSAQSVPPESKHSVRSVPSLLREDLTQTKFFATPELSMDWRPGREVTAAMGKSQSKVNGLAPSGNDSGGASVTRPPKLSRVTDCLPWVLKIVVSP